MDPKVKEFIEAAKSEERAKFEKKRNIHLFKLGLVNKVRQYSNEKNINYPYYDEKENKYYREIPVPVEVTDEEYEEIMRWAPKDIIKDTESEDNSDIKKFRAIGIIILVVEIISAFFLGKIHYELFS